ncbi:BTB/POZ protein [Jimgerdemannia flammicorona]|uniref:BTB/POZ protein n=1 Tax=Jimgerdemannia flammicorona TaxID=994334 RepID=A0A433QR52_9FUNG|nr:BTB/POZ protein [Jimgerdemannia flammicorona]
MTLSSKSISKEKTSRSTYLLALERLKHITLRGALPLTKRTLVGVCFCSCSCSFYSVSRNTFPMLVDSPFLWFQGSSQFQLRKKLVDALKTDEDPILLKAVIQIPNVEMLVLAPNPYSKAATATFLQNCQHRDVIFHVDGRIMYAHGGLLAAHSKHFAALLNDSKETAHSIPTEKAIITVTDDNHEAFLLMLRYLYTGSLDFRGCPEVKVVDLFKVADKYDVWALRDAMEDCINNLTVGSVVPLLFEFAYSYAPLRKGYLNFIGNNFEAVRKTGAFNKLERNPCGWEVYSELMREIVECVPTRDAEMES